MYFIKKILILISIQMEKQFNSLSFIWRILAYILHVSVL